MNDITILITAAGNQYMPGLVKCFRENGERQIRLVGADMNVDPTILQMMDVAYKVPTAKDSSYVDALLSICEKEKVDVVVPVMSEELIPIIDNINRFREIGVKVSIANRKVIEIVNNKFELYKFMQDSGMKVPKFCRITKSSELKQAFSYVGYPNISVCIKATNLSGSRGVRIVDPSKSRFDILFNEKPNSFYVSYDELETILSEEEDIPEMMVMEALPGEEFSVDLVADHGKILYMAARQSNSIIASIPQVATLFNDERAYEITREVIEKLGLDGSADLDFRYDRNGEPVLMEINPRVAATMAIFKEGGMNLPYLRVKQLLGESLPTCAVKTGIKMKRRYQEMFFCDDTHNDFTMK